MQDVMQNANAAPADSDDAEDYLDFCNGEVGMLTGPGGKMGQITGDPEIVVLGGGVAEAGAGLLDAVRRALRRRAARSPLLTAIDLADRAELVPDGVPAGALGAAVHAVHRPGPDDAAAVDAGPDADVASGTS